MLARSSTTFLVLTLTLAACTDASPRPATAPVGSSADASVIVAASATTAAPIDVVRADAGPPSAPAAEPADAAAAKPSPTDAGALAAPASVKLATIGMHVGGGPYDEATKEPLRRSVEPRFADLAACWRHVPASMTREPLDVGVDLFVEAEGGAARVTNPRARVKDEAFVRCVTDFYASVVFQKPLHGRTVVSYSVRFTP